MSYRRVMIFQRFSRNKLEKKKQNRGNCSKSGFTVANRGRTVPCKPCKTGLDLGWTGSQVRGARCPVSKFMDLFDTALQVHVPTVHFTLLKMKGLSFRELSTVRFNINSQQLFCTLLEWWFSLFIYGYGIKYGPAPLSYFFFLLWTFSPVWCLVYYCEYLYPFDSALS